MKKLYLVILLPLFLASCATIVNSPNKKIRFFSENESTPFILNNDTAHVYYTDTLLTIKRSKQPLLISVLNDSLPQYTYQIDSKLSPSYTLGNVYTYFTGYLIDLIGEKRYTYPEYIRLEEDSLFVCRPGFRRMLTLETLTPDPDNPQVIIQKRKKVSKPGKVNLVYIPLSIHSFNWETFNGRDTDNGAVGTALGLNYYLKPDLRLSGAFEVMIHSVGSDWWEEDVYYHSSDRADVFLAKVQIGKPVYKNLWADIGLQFFHSYYGEYERIGYETGYSQYYHPSYCEKSKYEYKNNLGLAISVGFNFGKNYLALNYYPSFLTFTTQESRFEYNHIIGVSFGFGITLKR